MIVYGSDRTRRCDNDRFWRRIHGGLWSFMAIALTEPDDVTTIVFGDVSMADLFAPLVLTPNVTASVIVIDIRLKQFPLILAVV